MTRTFIPYVGFEFEIDNKSIIVQSIAMTKENIKFTEEQIKTFIEGTSKWHDRLLGPEKSATSLFGKLNLNDKIEDTSGLTFHKFISKETYEKYISKGTFQLGSLKMYREIERKESRDVKEGFSNLIINSPPRQVLTSVLSGFNHYVLCGTHTLENSEFMKNNFGEIVIRIKNIESFAEKIKNIIGAKAWHVKKITYTDYKAAIFDEAIKNFAAVGPDLSEELFNILINASHVPSIFSKPISFSSENEIRLTFEMDKNVSSTVSFSDESLLNEIEIV